MWGVGWRTTAMVENMTDDNDGRLNGLSRRKLLGSMGAIGVAGAVGGLGTTALFSDTEQVGTTFTAGEMNLQLDYRAVYNGQEVADVGLHNTSEGEVALELNDLKQCDEICLSFSLHVDDNPAWVWLGTDYTEAENGVNEAERSAGDAYGGGGFSTQEIEDAELDDWLAARAFYDDSDDCQFNEGDDAIDAAFRFLGQQGPLTDIGSNGGLLLDGIRNETIDSRDEGDTTPYNPQDEQDTIHATPFFPTQSWAESEIERWWGGIPDSIDVGNQYGTQHLTFHIKMPCEDEGINAPVNQAQGDSVNMTFSFFAEQARHNGFPTSPWDDSLPDVSVDAVPAVESHITGGFSANDADYHIV